MQLPTEHERPTKLQIKKHPDGTITKQHVKFTDDEWREHLELQRQEKIRVNEEAKTAHLFKQEEELKVEVYPFLMRALCQKYFEGDDEPLKVLAARYQQVLDKHPAPGPGVSSAVKDRIE